MGDSKPSPKKGTDSSDSSPTATGSHPPDDSRSAEKRLEEAIDQTQLAINQLKARGDVLAESRARGAYTGLEEAHEYAETEWEEDD